MRKTNRLAYLIYSVIVIVLFSFVMWSDISLVGDRYILSYERVSQYDLNTAEALPDAPSSSDNHPEAGSPVESLRGVTGGKGTVVPQDIASVGGASCPSLAGVTGGLCTGPFASPPPSLPGGMPTGNGPIEA